MKVGEVIHRKNFANLESCYPLPWQKDISLRFRHIAENPQKWGLVARRNEARIRTGDWIKLDEFSELNLGRRYKVVDLWLGRRLGICSFPIDRHIQRELVRVGIKVSYKFCYDEFLDELIRLDYDPIFLEYAMIQQVKLGKFEINL
jgi:hypothetical protein